MSKNSAKTGSEGDADSNYTDCSPKAGSDTSSYRNLEGGPYGDIPPESTKQGIYKDYVLFMIDDNDSAETSESSDNDDDDEQGLYSLRNEYLQKLNIVRRRLNLAQIPENQVECLNSNFEKRCTITEIIEEDDDQNEEDRNNDSIIAESKEPECTAVPTISNSTKSSEKSGRLMVPKSPVANTPHQRSANSVKKIKQTKSNSVQTCSSNESVEIQTIYPFSLCYNKLNVESISNLLELEYNPPKKKSCYRLHTPKLPSASESNIPYHTKVSLHDGLFKKPAEILSKEFKGANKAVDKPFVDKFTVTREIQCNEIEFQGKESGEHREDGENLINHQKSFSCPHKENECSSKSSQTKDNGSLSRNYNLFPEVIVKYESPRQVIISSSCSTTASNATDKKMTNFYHPNFIEDSSAESYNTVTTNTTITDGSKKRKEKREKIPIMLKHTSKRNEMWQELRTLNSKDRGEVEAVLTEKDKTDEMKKKRSFIQYITYRKDTKRPKSSPIKMKTPVPFGPVILHDYEKIQNVDSKFYFFNSTSSEEEKYVRELYMGKFDSPRPSDQKAGRQRSWTRLFSCFESLVSIFKKSNKNVRSN